MPGRAERGGVRLHGEARAVRDGAAGPRHPHDVRRLGRALRQRTLLQHRQDRAGGEHWSRGGGLPGGGAPPGGARGPHVPALQQRGVPRHGLEGLHLRSSAREIKLSRWM